MKLKINKLTIEGFKCFEKETIISFNEITKILLGHNGCGKTSIIEAIRFVLTGEFPVDGINYLTEKAFVKADFDTMSIARLKSFGKTTVYLNDSQVTNKELDAVVETTFGLPKQSLKICTSSEVLANLSSADLGNFLKTYIPEEMTKIYHSPGYDGIVITNHFTSRNDRDKNEYIKKYRLFCKAL